jgi:hypothetical protein
MLNSATTCSPPTRSTYSNPRVEFEVQLFEGLEKCSDMKKSSKRSKKVFNLTNCYDSICKLEPASNNLGQISEIKSGNERSTVNNQKEISDSSECSLAVSLVFHL